MRIEKILSEFDGLGLEIAVIVPEGDPKGVIQFSHGMAEHKERYYDFMNYLSDHGYVCVMSMECVMLFAVFAIVTEPVLRYSTMLIEGMGRIFASRRRKRAVK